MSQLMRAAVLRECPGELEIADLRIDAPQDREVLVRTVAAGLCHSDLHALEGLMHPPVPIVMGHESAGIVEAVGREVRHVVPGDHVVTCLSAFCGHCDYCLTGRPYLCQAAELRRDGTQPPRLAESSSAGGSGAVGQFAGLGSFAERLLVHENALVKIDSDLPLAQAALVGCGVTTGVGAVLRTARVEPGSSVAVIGCGGIGLNCVQGAVLAGAAQIIGVDIVQYKRALATQFGATHTVDASAGDPVAQVLEISGGGVDYAFEAIGLPATAQQAFGIVRRGGIATVVGVLPQGSVVSLPGPELLGKRIQGSVMGSNRFRLDIPRYLELYRQGRLKLDELISARISLAEVNDGYRALRKGTVARSVVVFDDAA